MKMFRCVLWLTVLVVLILGLCLPITSVFAQDTQQERQSPQVLADTDNTTLSSQASPVQTDNITLTVDYPTESAFATDFFAFDINMDYTGGIQRVFDLKTMVPSGWDVTIQPQSQPGTNIDSIPIDASYSGMSKSVTLTATPPTSPSPDPSDYKILLQAISGNVTGSIELVARIIPKYGLQAASVNQLSNITALSGKDNIFSIKLTNTGTATIDSVTFNSRQPTGWEIKFAPDKLDTITTSDPKTVDVDIKPSAKTKTGDYMISLTASGNQTSAQEMDIRVSVQTQTIWGWVGVAIIVVIVAGLFVLLMRLGRR